MSDTKIEVGDFVEIYLDADQRQWVDGVVLHIPSDTGDAWHLKRKDGQLVYVQTYAIVYRKATP